jgi:hypothetical protein
VFWFCYLGIFVLNRSIGSVETKGSRERGKGYPALPPFLNLFSLMIIYII